MRFIHTLVVLPEEVLYVVPALNKEMPLPFNHIECIGYSEIYIETDGPLTLEQRRFLTGCGFSVTSEYE